MAIITQAQFDAMMPIEGKDPTKVRTALLVSRNNIGYTFDIGGEKVVITKEALNVVGLVGSISVKNQLNRTGVPSLVEFSSDLNIVSSVKLGGSRGSGCAKQPLDA